MGASEGQEAPTYHRHGYHMAFVEAIPEVFQTLKEKTRRYGAICVNACVSDEEKDIVFHVASNGGQSSSFLEFGSHSLEHPEVVFERDIKLRSFRTESLDIPWGMYDLLVMDLQGAELHALKGLGDKIGQFKWIYTEVNEKELYKGCALVGQLDKFLRSHGFERKATNMTPHGWGDAFYAKASVPKPSALQVPKQFQPRIPIKYPPYSNEEFEWYFFRNFQPTGNEEYTYLPVMWTAYQIRMQRRSRSLRSNPHRRALQDWLNKLDRSKRYFTIVQHDDGIAFDLPFDCKVFAMGSAADYQLPLICEPYKGKIKDPKRKYLASFMGSKTHPMRAELESLRSDDVYISFDHHDLPTYFGIMQASTFTLAPRGYGATSFRIQEALRMGSVPVYLSDKHLIPHSDQECYLYMILSKERSVMDQINSIDSDAVIELKNWGQKFCQDQFTYERNLEIIKQNI
ncbi:MAG: hypothetical protein F6K52_22335 [Moorea sp. SIO3H5]|nr:hypothetical protein [Moorena sp. SIO3H5]